MRELHVNENDSNQRVDKFLNKTLKKLPQSLMYKYIRNKKIKVNRQRCTVDQRLVSGDILQCYISEEFFDYPINLDFLQASDELNIIYEDESILVVNKSGGLLVHSDTADDHDTLIDRIQKYLYQRQIYDPMKENSFAPALANRIDRNTCGLVIAAKHGQALRDMNRLIKERLIEKRYLCIVEGTLPKPSDELHLFHQKQEGNRSEIVQEACDGYQAVSMDYQVLDTNGAYSLVEVLLHTGKSHQIRACFSYLKNPLLGDAKYGAKKADWKYQALCAFSLTFHPDESFESLTNLCDKTVCLKANPISDYYWNRIKK